jgi:hypothetical protein
MLTPVRLTIRPDVSRFEIRGRSSLHPIKGESHDVRGYIETIRDRDGTIAVDAPLRMHVEIPVASLSSGNALEDKQMRELIGSRSFPNIVADLQELQKLDEFGRYAAKGRIEVRGTGRAAEGELTVRRDGDEVVVEGEKTLDVRDFGIKPPRILMLQVYPDITVRFHLVAGT